MLYNPNIITIKNDVVSASFLSRGATWIDFRFLNENNVLVAYENLEDYAVNTAFLGSSIGPISGRIKNARIESMDLDLSANSGPNQLHGGYGGMHTLDFDVLIHEMDRVVFKARGNHQDDGYPGFIDYEVSYTLKHQQLILELKATPTQALPLSLTNHAYFNLSTSNSLDEHELFIDADQIVLNDETKANNGVFINVFDTPFDFTQYRNIDFNASHPQFDITRYIDHDYILKGHVGLRNESVELLVQTNMPAMRVYTANFFNEGFVAQHGHLAANFSAVAFEPQRLANGVNLGYDYTCDPEHPFESQTIYELRKR